MTDSSAPDGGTADDASTPPVGEATWRAQVIYLTLADRFFNGDPGNDDLGVPSCFDPSKPKKFHGGDIAGLRAKLDYLRSLGATTLWATPFYKQIPLRGDACGYHGYWPDFGVPDETSMDPKFGTPAELDGLLDDLHGRGMRFVLDVIVNHSGYGARVLRERPTWFHSRPSCEALGNQEIFCPLGALPDFAQELPEVAAYVTGIADAWVRRHAIDGIRMDTAKHVPMEYFRETFFPAMRAARASRPGLFSVAEVLDEGPYARLKPFVDAGFGSVFNFPLRRALVEAFAKGGSADLVADKVREQIATFGASGALDVTNLLDNHDVPRFMTEAGDAPQDELARRYALALTALFTLPGIPQLYSGDELGMLGAGNANGDHRRDMPSWAWDEATRPEAMAGYAGSPRATFELTRKLASLRASEPALRDGYLAEEWRPNGTNGNVFAFLRGTGKSRAIVVLSNQTAPPGILSLPIRGYSKIDPADRAALADGTVLADVLGAGGDPLVTVSDGTVKVAPPGKVPAIYVERPASGAAEVTFTVTATTKAGEAVYLLGAARELGGGDVARAVRMHAGGCTGARCTWSVAMKYLLHGSTHAFRFVRKTGSAAVMESGAARTFAVAGAASERVDGGEFREP